jgi:hypothetical protein
MTSPLYTFWLDFINNCPNFYIYFNAYGVVWPSHMLISAPFGFLFNGPEYGLNSWNWLLTKAVPWVSFNNSVLIPISALVEHTNYIRDLSPII